MPEPIIPPEVAALRSEVHRVFCGGAKHRTRFTGECRPDAPENILRGLTANPDAARAVAAALLTPEALAEVVHRRHPSTLLWKDDECAALDVKDAAEILVALRGASAMSEPTTQRLYCPHCGTGWDEVAVVRNARARALDDVMRAVKELPASCHAYADDAHPTEAIERRGVLAAIEALR